MNESVVTIDLVGDADRCLHCRLMHEAGRFMRDKPMRLVDVMSAIESVLVDLLACAAPTPEARIDGLEIFTRHVAQKFAALDAGPPTRPTAH